MAIGGEQLLQPDDVRMRDIGGAAELLLEPIERVGIENVELLDRDPLLVVDVLGLVDGAERARAQPADQLKAAA